MFLFIIRPLDITHVLFLKKIIYMHLCLFVHNFFPLLMIALPFEFEKPKISRVTRLSK